MCVQPPVRHTDHLNMSTAKEFIRRGIPVYAHEEVIKDAGLDGFLPLVSGKRNEVGQFSIQPFKVAHNVPNYGFLVETPEQNRIVFVTDTMECRYRFKDIDCIMVECNHDDDTLLDNLDHHDVSMSHPEYHMGLEDCCKFCKANISTSTKQIILIHLSHQNINEDFARQSVQDALPFVKVAVAHKGDVFNIENDNF